MPQSDPTDLEQTLRNLSTVGTLIKDRAHRQVWRFEFQGRPYYLKFFPRDGLRTAGRRLLRGSPALWEFQRLQWLQKAGVPAPYPHAVLFNFRLDNRVGDALVIHGIEPSITLADYVADLEMRAEWSAEHRQLVEDVGALIHSLGQSKLGHSDLHLGNFLLKENKIHLLDAAAVHKNGLQVKDVMMLAHSAVGHANASDFLRVWKRLGHDAQLPRKNPVSRRLWRQWVGRAFKDDRYFGRFDSREAGPSPARSSNEWSGHFFKHASPKHWWSQSSDLHITNKMWHRAWPDLLNKIKSNQLEILKRSRSGDVLAGEIELDGHKIPIIIKHPKRKHWWRYLNEIGRGSRARRAWKKAWELVIREIPTAWPLLLMEKRTLGYTTDALIVFERIAGKTLAQTDLQNLAPPARSQLLRRVGRLMRRLEESGRYLYDSKASNWIIHDSPTHGLTPMLIDVDGLRPIRVPGGGIERLLRSVRELPGANADDERYIRSGYQPWTTS